ncbi:DUF3152 domain-containing protein [Nakamurella aerolata]|uniref:DUF3152 domain-containing protein n=1 Tax=Nakamurella aerolata TaxID=1656892 RepID=A0A849A267_9ACTN|nr:DUF3152 domain-containing protein [Nakamurella aerolata]
MLAALTVVLLVQGLRPGRGDQSSAETGGNIPAAAEASGSSSPQGAAAGPIVDPEHGAASSPAQTAQAASGIHGTRTQAAGAQAASTAPTASSATSSPSPSGDASTGSPTAPSTRSSATRTAPDPNGEFAKAVQNGQLPPGGPVVDTGNGSWHVVPGTSKPFGKGPQRYTFSVEVEDGIQSKSEDKAFADAVVGILSDQRSWIGGDKVSLQRVDSGKPSFRISLTSPMTLRGPCGHNIDLESSCYNRSVGRVLINDARWVRGAGSYNGDLGLYRVYAINHEVGHALGFGHQACAEKGGLAPVMMQQTFSLDNSQLFALDPDGPVPNNGLQCNANPFPYPRG